VKKRERGRQNDEERIKKKDTEEGGISERIKSRI
jgi:hypothetical protein